MAQLSPQRFRRQGLRGREVTAFHAIQTFLDVLGKPGLDEKSRNFQAIQLREALDRAMPGLVRAGIAHQMQATRNPRGAELIESLLADLETILP
jgi:hypothetical protein